MNIPYFSGESVDSVLASLKEAFKAVEHKHGISVTIGPSVKYCAENCSLTVECAVIREDGESMTREAVEFRNRAAFYGLDPQLLFRSFVSHDGKRMKVVGLNAKQRSNPIVLKDESGTLYAASEETVRSAFGRAK